MESLRTFTGLLFLKQITGRELLFGSKVHTTGSNKDINYWIYLTEISYLSTICMRNGCRLRLLLLRISRASTAPIASVHTHQKQKIKQIKRQSLCKEKTTKFVKILVFDFNFRIFDWHRLYLLMTTAELIKKFTRFQK